MNISRREIVKQSRRPSRQRFYDSLADVPRNIEYEDGETIWIKDEGGYSQHVFRRTSKTDPAGGQLHPTGVTAGENVW
jgi:hypothetical protein